VKVLDDHTAECTISDEGPGFTAADREKIFRRYVRLSARPTGGEPSTGLGLSIVKRLVDAMKGRLTLETAPAHGATFTVRLPRAES
jgi:two-component system sensor histidine kinase/response regulator